MTRFTDHRLTPELAALKKKIIGLAEDYGLSFFPIKFLLVSPKELNAIAAYTGFPARIPHWTHGMEYEELQKKYTFGAAKIYELVINTNPVYAYLLSTNTLVDQKLVMAHVCGHADFFLNNRWFGKTDRLMLNQMANNAARLKRIIRTHGEIKVEKFIDACKSIENLIDPYMAHIKRKRATIDEEGFDKQTKPIPKLPAKEYMDKYINTPEFIEAQKKKIKEEKLREKKFPEQTDRDILGFLVDHAPLENWQRAILGMIREEAYYFAPQMMTKVMNEGWACVSEDTLVLSDHGFITMKELVESDYRDIRVSDGERPQKVYDSNIIKNHEAYELVTRRGLILRGSNNHRIRTSSGEWCRLDELKVGDTVQLSKGQNIWPTKEFEIRWVCSENRPLVDRLKKVGLSFTTYYRYKTNHPYVSDKAKSLLQTALLDYNPEDTRQFKNRKPIKIPQTITPDFGLWLGYLVGDGYISRTKRCLGLTSGDKEQIEKFSELCEQLFGIESAITFHKSEKDEEDIFSLDDKENSKRGKWRATIYSETLSDFLINYIGLTEGKSAKKKTIPSPILKSPKSVMSAFIRGLLDSDGYAGKQGIILATASESMVYTIQNVLLNYGILTRKRLQKKKDNGKIYYWWHVTITGKSANIFEKDIGFGLGRKKKKLQDYICNRKRFKKEKWVDTVVKIKKIPPITVYDISVDTTHRYVAGGLINHNSYWHSKLMTEELANSKDIIDYCERHAGVIAMSNSVNPYRLGLALYKDIEDRWNRGAFGPEYDSCTNAVEKENWNKNLGLGKEKIFQVRKTHNDLTFLDTFLTPEFCIENKLYSYKPNTAFDVIEIDEEFKKVKEQFLSMLVNAGQPIIQVVDGNYDNKGELLLEHVYDSKELDYSQAQDTLTNIYTIWSRPVHIQTIEDGIAIFWSYDGEEHTKLPLV